ncbi:MAG TPA: SurA N-terminal domain-containing protein [Clostridia bacterium]|nr:SurA N-terminal domain-containing protein [Clostridia bacterium]
MKRKLLVLALVAAATSSAFGADVLDRIVAVVNGRPVLQSDLDDAVCYEELRLGAPAGSASPRQRQQALDRLIDREIIRQQIESLYTPSQQEIARYRQNIRELFPAAKTDAEWEQVIRSYGFGPAELDATIASELQTLRFVEVRLQPAVRVERDEIEAYYREKLLPQLHARGATPDPLPQVAGRIEQVILEEKKTRIFEAWMTNLRTQSTIRVLAADDPSLGATSAKNVTVASE